MKITPFDFVKSASNTKKHLLDDEEYPDEALKEYVPYVVNKSFSHFEDSLLHANEMNMRHAMPRFAQYEYYFQILRKRNRFSKWHKPEKDDDVSLLMEHYQCSKEVAKMYGKCLSVDQIEQIRQSHEKGGETK